MSEPQFLSSVSALAVSFATHVVAWLATYLIHSTLLLGSCFLFEQLARSRWRIDIGLWNRFWRGAIVLPLLTASIASILDHDPVSGGLELTRSAKPTAMVFEVETEVETIGSDGPVRQTEILPHVGQRSSMEILFVALLAVWSLVALLRVRRFQRARKASLEPYSRRKTIRDSRIDLVTSRLITNRAAPKGMRISTIESATGPIAFGAKEVCLPTWAIEQLDDAELSSLIAHEASHLSRRDPFWLLLFGSFQELLFFQPLVRLAVRRFHETAEQACDRQAVVAVGSPVALARSLIAAAEWARPLHEVPTLASSFFGRPPLADRIESLIAGSRPMSKMNARVSGFGIALMMWLGAAAILWIAPSVSVSAEKGSNTVDILRHEEELFLPQSGD